MRFMMIVKASKDSEAGVMPSEELLSAMGKYNEELVKAGVLLDGAGLQPSSKGARIKFSGGKRTLIDGPFTESKELIAGYWIIQVKSREEAIEWARRAPAPHEDGSGEIEIRQFFELEDFAEEKVVPKQQTNTRRYHYAIPKHLQDRGKERSPVTGRDGQNGQADRGRYESRLPSCSRGLHAQRHRRARSPLRRQDQRDRRAFHRIQGGDRRLRDPSGELEGRGGRTGQAIPPHMR